MCLVKPLSCEHTSIHVTSHHLDASSSRLCNMGIMEENVFKFLDLQTIPKDNLTHIEVPVSHYKSTSLPFMVSNLESNEG